MTDNDFLEFMVGTPFAELSPERLKLIQNWLILVYKKIEFGVCNALETKNIHLSRTEIQEFTSTVWRFAFHTPLIELLQEEEIVQALTDQKIRPMTIADIFNSSQSLVDN
jgi:hypothetical protein